MRDVIENSEPMLLTARPPARRRPRHRFPVLAALAICTVAAIAGAVRYGVPVEATAHVVAAGPFPVIIDGPGTLEALSQTIVTTSRQGRIVALDVELGDHVSSGAAVARLEDDDLRADLAHAREQARAAAHGVAEARAMLDREAALLRRYERELDRQVQLAARTVISNDALDLARADRDAAVARVAEAEARIARLAAEAAAAERLVDLKAEAAAETVIAAPYDGIVTSRERSAGDVVGPGAAIFEIVDPRTIIFTARIDESQMARLAGGQEAGVRFASDPGRDYPATLSRIGREVDRETREFTIDFTLDSLPPNWALGQRGSVDIRVETKPEAMALPGEAIRRRDGAFGAWVLKNGRAAWRPLVLGAASGSRVEIVSGLAPGETVLSGPTLYPGMPVEPRP